MIISYTKRICFIHIPKCAGTTIRKLLRPIDEKSWEIEKNELKKRKYDIDHLPLFALEKFLPQIYSKIFDFDTYAIVRNPYERFTSAFSQRMIMYRGRKLHDLSKKELKHEIETLIEYLVKNNKENFLLQNEYIHFSKQTEYIFNHNQQLIKNIYTIDEIEVLIDRLIETINDDRLIYEREKENQTLFYKNSFLKRVKLVLYHTHINKIFYALPEKTKMKIKYHTMINDKSKGPDIFNSDYVRSFIEEYYKKDIDYYSIIKSKV